MMRKGLRIGAKHDALSRLKWLCAADGQRYLLDFDPVSSKHIENVFSSGPATHDPIACMTRSYQELMLTNALYSQLSNTIV